MRPSRTESGSILLDAFMGLFLGSIVLGTALSSFSNMWSRSTELRLKAELYSEARLLLDMLAFDVRMSGAGMPLGQPDFVSTNAAIGEAALPILSDLSSTNITLRLNELGVSTLLTQPFSPDDGSRSVTVASTAGFSLGDTIYISSMTSGGTSGLRGTIASISGTTIILANTVTPSQGAQFSAGSTIEPVKQIIYAQSQNGITRDDGSGPILLAPQSTMQLAYLDSQGTPLTLPLTTEAIENSLGAIRIHVGLRTSSAVRSDSSTYSTTTSQTVALRNINLNR
jgi:Tfp pilus assembly protein PilW